MPMGTIALVLDVLIAVLLAVTIVYAFVLHRKLNALRQGRQEMEALVNGLSQAAGRAEAASRTLKQTAKDVDEQLMRSMDRAKSLGDELSFMIDSGDSLANRLVEQRERSAPPNGAVPAAKSKPPTGRSAPQPAPPPARGGKSPDTVSAAEARRQGRSKAERDLIEAMEKRN